MSWEDVGSVADLERDGHVVARVGGREIGVVAVNGELRGVRNRCPHQGGSLCSGRQTGLVTSTRPGEYVTSRAGEIIRCPWHGWEFDPATGQCLDDEAMRVAVYPAKAEGGRVFIDI